MGEICFSESINALSTLAYSSAWDRSSRKSAVCGRVPERLERRRNGPRSSQIACQSSDSTVVERMEH